MKEVYFLGIDLAFSDRNNSGVAVLSGQWDGNLKELTYVGSRLCKTDEEITEFLRPYLLPGRSVVAVDAPLVVPNQSGMRPCERAVGRMYGQRQCSAYPAHQGNMAGTRGPRLLAHLESIGVPLSIDPRIDSNNKRVAIMETYPHAAHLSLFNLSTVWKYKKKSKRSWVSCRSELVEYWSRIWSLMPSVPVQALKVWKTDPLGQRLVDWVPAINGLFEAPEVIGKSYKEFEDLTDGLFCAYIAAHIGMSNPVALFSPTSEGLTDLSLYREGQDFIVVPAL